MNSVQYNLCIGGPDYLVKWTQSTRMLFEPICCMLRAMPSEPFFIKLIGQVIFVKFLLMNEPDIITKRGPYDIGQPSRPY